MKLNLANSIFNNSDPGRKKTKWKHAYIRVFKSIEFLEYDQLNGDWITRDQRNAFIMASNLINEIFSKLLLYSQCTMLDWIPYSAQWQVHLYAKTHSRSTNNMLLNDQIVSLSIELFLIRHVQRAVCSAESCMRYNVCVRWLDTHEISRIKNWIERKKCIAFIFHWSLGYNFNVIRCWRHVLHSKLIHKFQCSIRCTSHRWTMYAVRCTFQYTIPIEWACFRFTSHRIESISWYNVKCFIQQERFLSTK